LANTREGLCRKFLFSDPNYFFWSIERKIDKGCLAMEADKLTRMVRHIRIPKPDPENWCVEYLFTLTN
jgi:hypothetical protein